MSTEVVTQEYYYSGVLGLGLGLETKCVSLLFTIYMGLINGDDDDDDDDDDGST